MQDTRTGNSAKMGGKDDAKPASNNADITTMSEKQFRDSLDALLTPMVDVVSSGTTTTTTSSEDGETTKMPPAPTSVVARNPLLPAPPATLPKVAKNNVTIGVSKPSSTIMIAPPPSIQQQEGGANFSLPPQSPLLSNPTAASAFFGIPSNFPTTATSTTTNATGPGIMVPTPQVAASSFVGSTSSSSLAASITNSRKRPLFFAISEDEEDKNKRRRDRNAREQLRSQKVTDQINELRLILENASAATVVGEFKQDKFGVLLTTEKYIRTLQNRSAGLEAQHQKLLVVLKQSSELLHQPLLCSDNSRQGPSSTSSAAERTTCTTTSKTEDSSVDYIQSIDYKWIFDCCPFACSITAIDGRFMDCNKEFEAFTSYTRAELLPLEQHQQHQVASSRSRQASLPNSLEASSDYHDVAKVVTEKQDDDDCDTTSQASQPQPPSTPTAVVNMSIFNVLSRKHIENMFASMIQMLQYEQVVSASNAKKLTSATATTQEDTWERVVELCRRTNNKEAKLRITLVRSSAGLPRFFVCVLVPVEMK